MSDKAAGRPDNEAPAASTPELEEYYVEPPKLGPGDVAGVIGALLALLIVGVAGYVWLNPDLGSGDLRQKFSRRSVPLPETVQPAGQASRADTPVAADQHESGDKSVAATGIDMDTDGGKSAAAAGQPGERPRCASCGMFTDETLGLVQAVWNDGARTEHDCWTCAVDYSREHGTQLTSARVLDYAAGLEARRELDARAAWYLYDTATRIEGSMPPFTAAFADRAAAEAAQPTLGGEVADFDALMGKFHSAGASQ